MAKSTAMKPSAIKKASAIKKPAAIKKASAIEKPSKKASAIEKPTAIKKARFTVPEVWRKIVKKNERQGDALFDVLICKHAVPANDNTYRKGRSCPVCRVQVQQYADALPKVTPSAPPARQPRRPRRRKIAA